MRVHTMRELGAGQCTPHSVIFNNERLRTGGFGQFLAKILANWTVLRKLNFLRENQTKAGYSVCFAHLFLLAGHKENWLQFLLILIAVKNPILDLFWLARAKVVLWILERDELK